MMTLATISSALLLLTAQVDSVQDVDKVFQWANATTPGCAVGVARSGRTLLAKAYGMANLEDDVPITTQTVSEAGSVSKQFTAAAVLLLARDGKLSLDDPVRRYIPEVPDYGAPITIRHLLGHTSGLREWSFLVALSGWPRGTRAYSNADVLDLVSRQRALNFAPGTKFSYSNTNYVLAAIIVQRVSGMSLANFTKARLFQPLGMTHTEWRDDYTRIVKQRARAYQLDSNRVLREIMPFENAYGPGGLLTTVGDLLRWNEALTAGVVGDRQLVDAMETRGRTTGGVTRYGLGLWIGTYKGVPEIQHEGGTAAYRAYLARYPAQKLSVALLCNTGSINPTGLGRRVADVFLAGQLPPPAAPQSASSAASRGATLSPQQLDAAAGLYRETVTGEPLLLTVKQTAWSFENSSFFGTDVLIPLSAKSFVFPSGTARGDFVLDKQGNVKAFRVWTDATRDTTVHVRVAEWTPTAAELKNYEGTYLTEEADARFKVTLDQDRLVVQLRPGTNYTLVPRYRDFFETDLAFLRFERDPAGHVTGLKVSDNLSRNVAFVKQTRGTLLM